MDIREKLVELLKAEHQCPVASCSDCPYRNDEEYSCDSAAAIADHLIAHGVTVQEWVSVSESLPDDNDRVIVFRPNESETSAYKYCVMWGWSTKASLKHIGITHWMPLPAPPKGA